jgi:hypothetical protein
VNSSSLAQASDTVEIRPTLLPSIESAFYVSRDKSTAFGGEMKLLVAVLTCHRLDYFIDDQTQDYLTQRGLRTLDQRARVDAQRETWLASLPLGVDYKFFYGTKLRDITSKPNQHRPSPQPYLREPLGDETFLPVGDNYLFNSHKMRAICQYALDNGYDYLLRVDDDTLVYPERLFSTDWPCVFLSSAAMQAIAKSPITSYCDDLWVGSVMDQNGFERTIIDNIRHDFGDRYLAKYDEAIRYDYLALHSVTPDLMRRLWNHRATVLSGLGKGTAGQVSKTTPSLSANPVSGDEKSSSFVTSPTLPETPSPNSDLNSSSTSQRETIPSSSDSESSEIGFETISPASDISSTVMCETV